jgi:hypothetical protein
VCVRNDGYEASLERNKIYSVLPDAEAERDGDMRVVDAALRRQSITDRRASGLHWIAIHITGTLWT